MEIPGSALTRERMLKRSFAFGVAIIAGIALDQVLKNIIFLQRSLPAPLVKFKNYYFAFSIRLPVWLIFCIYALILFFACWYCLRRFAAMRHLEITGWVLLFAGALSNVGERIILGYVRDYFFILNGIFNLADFFIIGGIALLVFGSSAKNPAR